jgi:hypothetical protein
MGLPDGKPVSEANALGRHALHARNPVRQLGRQKPVVGGLDGQLADGGDPDVDGNGAQPAGLQGNAGSFGAIPIRAARQLARPSRPRCSASTG